MTCWKTLELIKAKSQTTMVCSCCQHNRYRNNGSFNGLTQFQKQKIIYDIFSYSANANREMRNHQREKNIDELKSRKQDGGHSCTKSMLPSVQTDFRGVITYTVVVSCIFRCHCPAESSYITYMSSFR